MSQTPHTKAAKIRALLMRAEGVTLPDICKATGWQPHTARAFLSGLRKNGDTIERQPGQAKGHPALYRIASRQEDAS